MRAVHIALVGAFLVGTPAYAATLNLNDFVLFAGIGPVTLGNGVKINSGAVGTNGNISGGTTVNANDLDAGGTITTGNGTTISSGSSVVAGGKVKMGTSATVNSGNSVVSGGDLSLGNGADLGGPAGGVNVTLGGTLSHGTGYTGPASLAEGVGGPVPFSAGSSYQLPTLPAGSIAGPSTAAGGSVTNATLPAGALTPGDYGDVSLGNGKTLNLTAGTYHFTSIDMGTNDHISYDLTGGPINVFIDGKATLGNGMHWDLTGGDASDIYWELYGDLKIGETAIIYGTIFASGVAVLGQDETFSNGGTYTGQYLATGGLKAGTKDTFNLLVNDRFISAENVIGATPIPTTLPLLGTGLGIIGLLGWRRKRKAAARAA